MADTPSRPGERSGSGHVEREVKIRVASTDAIERALIAAGAAACGPWMFEDNVLYDDSQGVLSARGGLLRVRTERPAAGSTNVTTSRGLVTFKGPARVDAGAKVRDEIETWIEDAAAFREILEHAGFKLRFRYQKRRRRFALRDAEVAVDRTPVGDFIEIEGPQESIDSIAAQLGHRAADYLSQSYGRLWREAHPDGPRDMLLPAGGESE